MPTQNYSPNYPQNIDKPREFIEEKLQTVVPNKARRKCIAAFLIAILAVQTVGLPKIANVFPSQVQKSSVYKRLQRLLREFEFDQDKLALFLAALCNVPGPWVLSLDRTNWKFGKSHLNILMLSIVSPGITFPLLWTTLTKNDIGKAGNSNTEERIALLERFFRLFSSQKGSCLLADREFASKEFLDYFDSLGSFYEIRLKSTLLIADSNGEMCSADHLFHRAVGQILVLGWRKVLGKRRFVVGTRLETGDYLIVVSNREFSLDHYRLRWGIETMFGSFKTGGFHLEDTHVSDPIRLSRLVALLCLAYTWAGVCGRENVCGSEKIYPVKLRVLKHGRAPICLLRLGLDLLQNWSLSLCRTVNKSQETLLLNFLSCT